MSPSSRLLSSVRLRKAENVTHGWDHRLQVQLWRLRQESLLSVVVEVEEGGTSFNLGLDDGGRGDLEVASAEEVFTEAVHHDGTELQDLEESNKKKFESWLCNKANVRKNTIFRVRFWGKT